MTWLEAEDAIRSYLETQWAGSAYYADFPLIFENEVPPTTNKYVALLIEGTYGQKGPYGSVGKRLSIEAGNVYYHVFVPTGETKREALAVCVALGGYLQLQRIGNGVTMDGANPPSPIEYGDDMVTDSQPGGQFYRCSGSVPFIVIGAV